MAEGISVLIVDSNFQSRTALTMALIHAQYRVTAASNGQNGLLLTWRDKPDIVFLNVDLPDISGIEVVKRLRAESASSDVTIIGFGSGPTAPVLMSAFLEAGGTQFLPRPVNEITNLEEVLPTLVKQQDTSIKSREGCMTVFLSAKGGVGTSSLCANIANGISRVHPEASIIVADFLLPIGSIAPIVGYEGDFTVSKLTGLDESEITPDYFRANAPFLKGWNYHLLAGSPDPDHAIGLQIDKIDKVLKVLKATYDYVLIDVGRSLSRISVPIILDSCVVAMVMGTDLSSVNLTKTVWTYLHSKGVEDNRVYAILNRAVGLEGLTKTEAEAIAGFPIQATIPYMGGNFALANNRHEPILLKFPNDTAAMMIQQISNQIPQLSERIRATRQHN